jgi:two-component system, NarL family, sensor histidine kinase DevS
MAMDPETSASTRALSLPERLERLIEEAPSIINELALEGVLQRLADLAAEVIGARYVAVGMLGTDGRTLETFTTHGLPEELHAKIGNLPKGEGILGVVIREGRSIRIQDLMSHPARAGFPAHHPPMHSFLGVPIIGRRGVLGDLYMTEKVGADEFSEEDEHLATLFAAQAAAAIENARLHEESARLIEEVQRLHRSRERFFAMVNHELRNALAGVFGWAEMLVRRKDPHTVPRAAYEVLDSAERAIELINDLLDLSRLDEDRLRPVIKVVDCGRIVLQAFSRLTPAAEKKTITLETGQAEALPPCRTDASRVEQILVNLVGNAIKHSPEGSTVRVEIEHRPPNIVFAISDSGPGIQEEDVERIFDVYHTTASAEGHSAGLGLPLSRRLARLLDGDIRAEPRPAGGGYFLLSLPAAQGR